MKRQVRRLRRRSSSLSSLSNSLFPISSPLTLTKHPIFSEQFVSVMRNRSTPSREGG